MKLLFIAEPFTKKKEFIQICKENGIIVTENKDNWKSDTILLCNISDIPKIKESEKEESIHIIYAAFSDEYLRGEIAKEQGVDKNTIKSTMNEVMQEILDFRNTLQTGIADNISVVHKLENVTSDEDIEVYVTKHILPYMRTYHRMQTIIKDCKDQGMLNTKDDKIFISKKEPMDPNTVVQCLISLDVFVDEILSDDEALHHILKGWITSNNVSDISMFNKDKKGV